MTAAFPALNIVDCIDFQKTAALCVDSGCDVAPDMKFYFYIPGTSNNLSHAMSFAEVWRKTKGGNEIHWFWKVGQAVLKDYNGAPWNLDYQSELRRLKIHPEPKITLDFTADPEDLERGVEQPPHLTERLFGVLEEVCYDTRRISEKKKIYGNCCENFGAQKN